MFCSSAKNTLSTKELSGVRFGLPLFVSARLNLLTAMGSSVTDLGV